MTEKHTKAELAASLAEIPGMPLYMITRAIDGYYHDCESPLSSPTTQLIDDLNNIARSPTTLLKAQPLIRKLIERVNEGDFDPNTEELEAYMASPEGQQTIRELLGEDNGIQASH